MLAAFCRRCVQPAAVYTRKRRIACYRCAAASIRGVALCAFRNRLVTAASYRTLRATRGMWTPLSRKASNCRRPPTGTVEPRGRIARSASADDLLQCDAFRDGSFASHRNPKAQGRENCVSRPWAFFLPGLTRSLGRTRSRRRRCGDPHERLDPQDRRRARMRGLATRTR